MPQGNALMRRDRVSAAGNPSAALDSAFKHRMKLDVPLVQRSAVERHLARDGFAAERVSRTAANAESQRDKITEQASGEGARHERSLQVGNEHANAWRGRTDSPASHRNESSPGRNNRLLHANLTVLRSSANNNPARSRKIVICSPRSPKEAFGGCFFPANNTDPPHL
jgi:hypothetical protein